MIVIVMGVSGCGKTTVGRLLAETLSWGFIEADGFHPAANVDKMRRGEPLTDEDREPWLRALREEIDELVRTGQNAVLACSALSREARRLLSEGLDGVKFAFLCGRRELIAERLKARKGHFFDPRLLDSQFEALEAPECAIKVDIDASAESIAHRIARHAVKEDYQYIAWMRNEIHHEHSLINQRLVWMMTVQGVLLAAYTFSLEKLERPESIGIVQQWVPRIGLAVAILCAVATFMAIISFFHWHWRYSFFIRVRPVYRSEAVVWSALLLPMAAPFLFMSLWCVLLRSFCADLVCVIAGGALAVWVIWCLCRAWHKYAGRSSRLAKGLGGAHPGGP